MLEYLSFLQLHLEISQFAIYTISRLKLMHIISQKRIKDAQKKHPHSITALDGWYRIVKKNNFEDFADLKKFFNSVDKVKHYYIFDIGGNKLRLIASINFPRKKILIRDILTHAQYEKSLFK